MTEDNFGMTAENQHSRYADLSMTEAHLNQKGNGEIFLEIRGGSVPEGYILGTVEQVDSKVGWPGSPVVTGCIRDGGLPPAAPTAGVRHHVVVQMMFTTQCLDALTGVANSPNNSTKVLHGTGANRDVQWPGSLALASCVRVWGLPSAAPTAGTCHVALSRASRCRNMIQQSVDIKAALLPSDQRHPSEHSYRDTIIFDSGLGAYKRNIFIIKHAASVPETI